VVVSHLNKRGTGKAEPDHDIASGLFFPIKRPGGSPQKEGQQRRCQGRGRRPPLKSSSDRDTPKHLRTHMEIPNSHWSQRLCTPNRKRVRNPKGPKRISTDRIGHQGTNSELNVPKKKGKQEMYVKSSRRKTRMYKRKQGPSTREESKGTPRLGTRRMGGRDPM